MLRRFAFGFAAMAATLLLFALPASAQQRIALVIGNAAYANGPIRTSLADGGLVAEALTSVGFDIVEGADVSQNDLRRLFRDFLAKVEAGGPDTIAVVYFSGYGLEFEGENYLIPVDARLERDSDIPLEGVRLFDLMRPLADLPVAAKIIMLDAARPLPFRIQGGRLARGLGAIVATPGMIVGFSSAPGTVATDGDGPYGAYATAIAEMVREPGLDLENLFARIRVRTYQATNGAQMPWNVSQDINPQVMLVPGAPVAPPRVSSRTPRPMRGMSADQAYAMAIEDDDLGGYTEFVRVYPDSPYTARIWAVIRERREALAWRRALLINTRESYWTYLARYPDGMYAFDAELRLRRHSAGLRPPSGFRMLDFDDVPPPLAGEPTRLYDTYPTAPAPRFIGPPPAFIVGLPPPGRPAGHGLWRRQTPLPVIIQPGSGVPFQKKGPIIVNQPPGGTPPGFQGPPPNWQKPGTGIPKGSPPPTGSKTVTPTPTPSGPPSGSPKGPKSAPLIVSPTPSGSPKGTKSAPLIVSPTPSGPPPKGADPGFKGPPSNWQKPGTGVATTPPNQQQQQQQQQHQQQKQLLQQQKQIQPQHQQQLQIKQVPPPKAPVVSAPVTPKVQTPTVAPKVVPQGTPQGQKKCVVVNGQQVCK